MSPNSSPFISSYISLIEWYNLPVFKSFFVLVMASFPISIYCDTKPPSLGLAFLTCLIKSFTLWPYSPTLPASSLVAGNTSSIISIEAIPKLLPALVNHAPMDGNLTLEISDLLKVFLLPPLAIVNSSSPSFDT